MQDSFYELSAIEQKRLEENIKVYLCILGLILIIISINIWLWIKYPVYIIWWVIMIIVDFTLIYYYYNILLENYRNLLVIRERNDSNFHNMNRRGNEKINSLV
jgi:uncharacterized protein YacL